MHGHPSELNAHWMPAKLIVAVMALCTAVAAAAADDKSGVKPTAISLPSGPGSIEGLGESFQPQLNSGTASYAVNLKVPPGRTGFAPELTLSYNSGSGNGVYGMGWSVPVPSIQRHTDKRLPFYADYGAPDLIDNDRDGAVDNYEEYDVVTYSNGEELVPVADGFFRLQNEGEFTRFAREGAGWTGTRRDGTKMYFGRDAASQVSDGGARVFRWLLERMVDTNGNTINYVYQQLDATTQTYLKEINYNPASTGGGMLVEFLYEIRPDLLSDFRPGFELRTGHRCREIKMSAAGTPVRSYKLAYESVGETQPLSLLSSVTQFGRDGTSSLPPATFTYTTFDPAAASTSSMPSAPAIALGGDVDLLDLDGDALPDVLDTSAGAHAYYLNRGRSSSGAVEWASRVEMPFTTNKFLSSSSIQLVDADGDGRTDLLDKFANETNLYELDASLIWRHRRTMAQAGFNLSDPDVRMLDLNGDKRMDVLLTTETDYIAWINLGGDRWSAPYNFPAPGFGARFSSSTIRLADMNGDRMQDIVRLDDGVCVYYPSRGWGAYGAAVVMNNAPAALNPSKLSLNDVNGDGLSDVLYVDGFIGIALNRGFDSTDETRGHFSTLFTLAAPYNDTSTVLRQADVNGNGSSDLLFNTYPSGGADTFAFVDFSPAEQPYQLKTMANGIGRKTTLFYRSSVDEMVRDRAGTSVWTSVVPFPVQVVGKIENRVDLDANLYETLVDYHDGYYDGVEKEFRGFASAEQTEVGDDAQGAPTLITAHRFDAGKGSDAMKGKPLFMERRTATGGVFDNETYSWSVRTLASGIPGDARAVRIANRTKLQLNVLELGNGTPALIESEYEYDDFGNVTKESEYGRVEDVDGSGIVGDSMQDRAAWNDERVTVRKHTAAFASGQSAWILGVVVEQELGDEQGTVAARTRNYFDDETFSTSPSAMGVVSRGNLTMTLDWVDPAVPTEYVMSVRQKYDGWGNRVAILDPMHGRAPGHFREIRYDEFMVTYPSRELIYTGNSSAGSNPTLEVTAEYDVGFGVANNSTDFNGNATQYKYDSFGRLSSVVRPGDSPASPTIAHSYHLGVVTADGTANYVETQVRGGALASVAHRTRTHFDGQVREIAALSEGSTAAEFVATSATTFTKRGKARALYLPRRTSSLERSAPTGTKVLYSYDALGRRTRVDQPITASDSEVLFATEEHAVLKVRLQNEEQNRLSGPRRGSFLEHIFDGRGNVVAIREAVKLSNMGEVTAGVALWDSTISYDVPGNVAEFRDSQQNVRVFRHDGLSRVYFRGDANAGSEWTAYDLASNVTRIRDARGVEKAFAYDGANRPLKQYLCLPNENLGSTLSAGARWTAGLNTPPTRAADAELRHDVGDAVRYGALLRPEDVVDSVLQPQTDPAQHDLTGDAQVDVADVVAAVGIAVLRTGSQVPENMRGRVASIRDSSGTQYSSYDTRGRVAWVVRTIDTPGTPTAIAPRSDYEYDRADRKIAHVYPDSTRLTIERDHAGRVARLSGIVGSIAYAPSGDLEAAVFTCGVALTKHYDARNRLASYQATRVRDSVMLENYSLRYDGVSNISSVTDLRADADFAAIADDLSLEVQDVKASHRGRAYAYDDLQRLTQTTAAVPAAPSQTFQYDRIGNLVLSGTSTPVAMRYGGAAGSWGRVSRASGDDPGPQALSAIDGAPETRLAYDAAGNVVSSGANAFAYDGYGRLSSAGSAPSASRFYYDYAGVRVAKASNTERVLYFDNSSEWRDGKLHKFAHLDSFRVALTTTSSTSFVPEATYLRDHSGSAVLALGAGAQVDGLDVTDERGRQVIRTTREAAPAFPYTFIDRERDATGLLHLGARYYDPETTRFVAADPRGLTFPQDWLTNPQRLNVYAYSRNNPVAFSDRTGLAETSDLTPSADGAVGVDIKAALGARFSSGLGLFAEVGVKSYGNGESTTRYASATLGYVGVATEITDDHLAGRSSRDTLSIGPLQISRSARHGGDGKMVVEYEMGAEAKPQIGFGPVGASVAVGFAKNMTPGAGGGRLTADVYVLGLTGKGEVALTPEQPRPDWLNAPAQPELWPRASDLLVIPPPSAAPSIRPR